MLHPIGAAPAAGLQTLDEPVSETLKRDLRAIGVKLKFVLLPFISEEERVRELRNWDLWVRDSKRGSGVGIEKRCQLTQLVLSFSWGGT